MVRISRLPASATFGGVLLLAILAAAGTARADVTEVFNLFGEFANGSMLSGTVTVDTTAGSATAIDAAADGFHFTTITGQSSDGFEYTVNADTAGTPAQLSLVFGVHNLVGYGGSSLSPDTTLNGISLRGGGSNPAESSTVPEPSTWAMLIVGFAGVGVFAFRRAQKASA
jgi:PEP-CTERM motif